MEPIQPLQTGGCGCSAAAPQPAKVGQQRSALTIALLGMAGLALWYGIYSHLHAFSMFFTYDLLSISRPSRLGDAIQFFFYDVPKVMLLLTLIVFLVGILRSFFTQERTRRILAGKRETIGNVMAALLGVVTPFCSCSAVPLFLGFVQAGVPLGVTLSLIHI